MNLARLAAEALERGKPVRAGLIGAGKFDSMILSQVPTIAGAASAQFRVGLNCQGSTTAFGKTRCCAAKSPAMWWT